LASGQDSDSLSTCTRMIDSSRAEVVASVFQDAIHRRACSPNGVRPACGDTWVPVTAAVLIWARNTEAPRLVRKVLDSCRPAGERQ